MEVFSHTSKYITQLIYDFQHETIDKRLLNKNILLTSIFNYYYTDKLYKKNNKIQEEQNKKFQTFFVLEQKQEESGKQLMSKIKDRKSKKIAEESIQEQKENLINDLGKSKNMKLFQEHTFNTYIPPKNISLTMNLEITKKNRGCEKYISNSNIELSYINPDLSDKNQIITDSFIEHPYIIDSPFNENIEEKEKEIDNSNNEHFLKMISEEDDEILFYDESLTEKEEREVTNRWLNQIKRDDIIPDFIDLKQRKKSNKSDNLSYILKQNNLFKKEISENSILYKEMASKDHFQEFTGYLSEKTYKSYMKKMNYTYLILMLLSYFDLEDFIKHYEQEDKEKTVMVFIKQILLFSGVITKNIYDNIVQIIAGYKGIITFENYLNCFWNIFGLSNSYQTYKYKFLLFLTKKKGSNIISLNNYKLFCDVVKGNSIYKQGKCDDIIGKMIPIIKAKYPKDDLENLNYQHISLVLEYILNFDFSQL